MCKHYHILIALGLVLFLIVAVVFSTLALFPCNLIIFLSITFGSFPFFGVCIYYRFLVCGYHEI